MAQEEAGFALYLAHQGVVYAALAQLGIRRDRSDFQDWRDDGMLVYLNYFNRYRDPLTDEAAIRKFNKLAWHFVYLTLMQRMQKNRQRSVIERLPSNITLLQKTTFASTVLNVQTSLEWDGQLQRLAAILTPMERTVLGLRLAYLSDAGIAGRLQISRQRVLKIRKQLQAKYRQIVG
ncbi:DNA-binding response regulator [Lacticaseibacillus paracasei]|uniref:DNA-binding response regulator n=1 Tax=Lacticaseibacillus paracasei TaxID=1597 RepID=UPI000FF7FD81|nr:DNA-binding response regulator [Lacticaseibacillus paracasei]RND68528.1 hypothetical protein FAM18126_00385 [Lacticaseibacillus paracasei]